MKVEIVVPEEYAGSVMGDLSSRRGRPAGHGDPKAAMQLIRAEVPLSEMLSYDAEPSLDDAGPRLLHMEMDHYDEVPRHLQEKIISDHAKTRKAEVVEE